MNFVLPCYMLKNLRMKDVFVYVRMHGTEYFKM